ncbi:MULTISPECIES: alpha/beta fold hydrolase [unclassified Pseudovibrio]|uniref:thioesterase II family protein n=1 Tax=unclassified Pseudovibrio TaxID=2627060 RepID=UPI00070C4689|nr:MULTISPECIES: alpha/beta fold hydrolase [unclassified Pseudovibrio]
MMPIDLFCIPYSGSSATTYYKWRPKLNEGTRLVPLELAGRGMRMREPLYQSVEEAVSDLYEKLVKERKSSSYVIFGHSVGGLLTFELTQKILAKGEIEPPSHLFFSACRPPHSAHDEEVVHTLPNDRFMEKIFALGGTSIDVLSNPSLMEMFLPIIRADYRLYETYVYPGNTRKLPCPVTILSGDLDKLATPECLTEWQVHAPYGFQHKVLQDTGHFFVEDRLDDTIASVNTVLSAVDEGLRETS